MNAEAIQAAYEQFIEAEERRPARAKAEYVYASQYSACTRQIALDLIHPNSRPQFSADTLANFRRGNDRARDIRADMTRIGRLCDPHFDLQGGEERFELRDRKGRVIIVGKVDFRLKFEGRKGAMPVEQKSWHPNLTQGVHTFDDLFRNRFLRKGAFQLLCYIYGSNEPDGLMLLDRPGIPKMLDVRLEDHLDRIEDFLVRAEVAMDAKEKVRDLCTVDPTLEVAMKLGEAPAFAVDPLLPPFHDDPKECKMCHHFGSLCNPPLKYDGAKIFTDEDVILKTERYAEIEEVGEEYEQLDKWAKNTFRGVTNAIVGKCLVTGKWGKNTITDIPKDKEKEVAAQLAEIVKPYRKTIEQGKFFLTVTKVTE